MKTSMRVVCWRKKVESKRGRLGHSFEQPIKILVRIVKIFGWLFKDESKLSSKVHHDTTSNNRASQRKEP